MRPNLKAILNSHASMVNRRDFLKSAALAPFALQALVNDLFASSDINLPFPTYTTHELSNGAKLYVNTNPNGLIASGAAINYGSIDDPKGKEGIAHLMEHLVGTGGTKKYHPEHAYNVLKYFGNNSTWKA